MNNPLITKKAILYSVLGSVCCCCFLWIYINSNMICETIEPAKVIEIPQAERSTMQGFTCTGLSYDSVDDAFWVGNYGREIKGDILDPSLIEISKDFTTIKKEIRISDIIEVDETTNIQGVAYDTKRDHIYFTDGNSIICIDKTGRFLNSICLEDYRSYIPNGLAYDAVNDSLWVLFYHKYLLNISLNGDVIKKLHIDLDDQDMIAFNSDGMLYMTVGADYNGTHNYLYHINLETGRAAPEYQLLGSYAVEGVAFFDGDIYVMNDGLFHGAADNRNIVCVYDAK